MKSTTTATEITWRTTDLSLDRIVRILGDRFVAAALARTTDAAISLCRTRAVGAWDANDRESYAAFRSLAVRLGWGEGYEGAARIEGTVA